MRHAAEIYADLARLYAELAELLGGPLPANAQVSTPARRHAPRRAPLRERPREDVPVDEIAQQRARRALRRHGIS
jgi:hypothetical protein